MRSSSKQTQAEVHAVCSTRHLTAMQARRAERQRSREDRAKNLGGVLRKDSTPGLPLAVAIASGMAVVQQACIIPSQSHRNSPCTSV